MLLIREEVPLEEAVRAVEGAGVAPVVSELSQTVYLTDFVTTSRVPLALALKRVLPEDPRRTVWLNRLTEYFRTTAGGDSWRILYVPERFENKAARALSRWRGSAAWGIIAGIVSRGSSLLWIPAVFMLALVLGGAGKSLAYLSVSALPWLPLWFSGRTASVLAGLFGYLAVITAGSENNNQPGRILSVFTWDSAVRLAFPATAFLLSTLSDFQALPGIILSGLSAFALSLAVETGYLRLDTRRIHPVFEGPAVDRLRLESDRDTVLRYRTRVALLASIATLGLSGLPSPGSRRRACRRRNRIQSSDSRGTGRQSSSLGQGHRGLSGQVEPIPNCRTWRMPWRIVPIRTPCRILRIGSRTYGNLGQVIVENYSLNGTEVLKSQTLLEDFNEAWVRETLREERSRGIGAVLGSQKGLTRVEKGSSPTDSFIPKPCPKGCFLLYNPPCARRTRVFPVANDGRIPFRGVLPGASHGK